MGSPDKGAGKADRLPGQSGDPSRREKRIDSLPSGPGGADGVPDHMVRSEDRRRGKHSATNKNVKLDEVGDKVEKPTEEVNKSLKSSKKLTLSDYRSTSKTVQNLLKLNQAAGGKSPLPRPPYSPSPSPPRSRESVEDSFGFYEPGMEAYGTRSHETLMEVDNEANKKQRFSGFSRREVSATVTSADQLDKPTEKLMFHGGKQNHPLRAFGEDTDMRHNAGQNFHSGDVHSEPVPSYVVDMALKFGAMQAKMDQQNRLIESLRARDDGTKKDDGIKARDVSGNAKDSGSKKNDAADSDSPLDSDEEMEDEVDWGGQLIENKANYISISEAGLEFWHKLIGVDTAGQQENKFRKIPKNIAKLKQFTEGEDTVKVPKGNNELPALWGWSLKVEDELVGNQKYVGASAAGVCSAIDNLRSIVEDLKASARDFEEGTIEDPAQEAVQICDAVVRLIEESAIATSVQSLRFLAYLFGHYTIKRHDLALKQVTDTEAKKILVKTSPDIEYLFGRDVSKSVQQIRDSNQMKQNFLNKKRTPRVRKPYSNEDKGKFFKKPFKPRTERFKGSGAGRRYNKGKKLKKNDTRDEKE